VAEVKKTSCIFGFSEVKEAVEFIMADGANEATEVIKFT
jgi:hypothetical protein